MLELSAISKLNVNCVVEPSPESAVLGVVVVVVIISYSPSYLVVNQIVS